LVLGEVGGVAARFSTVEWLLKNVVITALRAVEAIANGVVGVAFNTRLRTSIDFSCVTSFSPVGCICERTIKASSNFGSINNKDLDVCSSSSIGRTIARESHIVANTVNRGTRWALERVISQVSTSHSTTLGRNRDSSVAGLFFSSTKSTSSLRPLSPWSQHAINWATSCKAV